MLQVSKAMGIQGKLFVIFRLAIAVKQTAFLAGELQDDIVGR